MNSKGIVLWGFCLRLCVGSESNETLLHIVKSSSSNSYVCLIISTTLCPRCVFVCIVFNSFFVLRSHHIHHIHTTKLSPPNHILWMLNPFTIAPRLKCLHSAAHINHSYYQTHTHTSTSTDDFISHKKDQEPDTRDGDSDCKCPTQSNCLCSREARARVGRADFSYSS